MLFHFRCDEDSSDCKRRRKKSSIENRHDFSPILECKKNVYKIDNSGLSLNIKASFCRFYHPSHINSSTVTYLHPPNPNTLFPNVCCDDLLFLKLKASFFLQNKIPTPHSITPIPKSDGNKVHTHT